MLSSIISAFLPKHRRQDDLQSVLQTGATALPGILAGGAPAAVQATPSFFPGGGMPANGGITRATTPAAVPAAEVVPQVPPPVVDGIDPLHPKQSVLEKYGTVLQPNQTVASNPETINANASEKPNDVPVADSVLDEAAVKESLGEPTFYPGMNVPSDKTAEPPSAASAAEPPTNKLEGRRRAAYDRRAELLEHGAPKEEKFWKRALRGALLGLGSGRGLAGALGGAVTGATVGGFFPGADAAVRTPIELAKVNREIEGIEGERNADQKYQRGALEQENIREDNRRLAEQGEARIEQKKKDGSWKALNRLVQQKHYDPKNPAHVRLAEQSGVDPSGLTGWDDRNPLTKQVAGVTYQLNRSNGSFEPTNLPTDEAKVLTDYEVTMPNGEKRKYRVSQKDAANFATQMSTLGARFEENARQRDWQSGENDKNRSQALSIAQERIGIAKENLRLAQQRYELADANAKGQADQDVQKAKQAMIRLQAYLKNSPLILPDDPIWQDFEELNK